MRLLHAFLLLRQSTRHNERAAEVQQDLSESSDSEDAESNAGDASQLDTSGDRLEGPSPAHGIRYGCFLKLYFVVIINWT